MACQALDKARPLQNGDDGEPVRADRGAIGLKPRGGFGETRGGGDRRQGLVARQIHGQSGAAIAVQLGHSLCGVSARGGHPRPQQDQTRMIGNARVALDKQPGGGVQVVGVERRHRFSPQPPKGRDVEFGDGRRRDLIRQRDCRDDTPCPERGKGRREGARLEHETLRHRRPLSSPTASL